MSRNKENATTNGLPILKEGYLRKTGKFESSNWKKRYFIIFGHLLSTFDSPPAVGKNNRSKRNFDVFGAKITPHQLNAKDPKTNTDLFLFSIIQSNGKCLTLRAKDLEEMEDWILSLVQASTYRPRSQSCFLFSSAPSQISHTTTASAPPSSNAAPVAVHRNNRNSSAMVPSSNSFQSQSLGSNVNNPKKTRESTLTIEECFYLPTYSSSTPNQFQHPTENATPRYENYNVQTTWGEQGYNNNYNYNTYRDRSESMGGRLQSEASYPELASFMRISDSGSQERDLIQQRLNSYNGGPHVYQPRNSLFSF